MIESQFDVITSVCEPSLDAVVYDLTSQFTIVISTTGMQGAAGLIPTIANNEILANTSGSTAAATGQQITSALFGSNELDLAHGGLGANNSSATSGQIPIFSSTAFTAQTIAGDASLSSSGALTVTKTNGTAFAPSAVVDTTNAGNIVSGTLAPARMAIFTPSVNGLAPASGGGTANFLRADGTWDEPAGGGFSSPVVQTSNFNIAASSINKVNTSGGNVVATLITTGWIAGQEAIIEHTVSGNVLSFAGSVLLDGQTATDVFSGLAGDSYRIYFDGTNFGVD